jgi:hypothetical protein
MLIKWDTLLVAAALIGGSVLIENSHRVDTGTPDDEIMASAPAACIDTQVTASLVSGGDNSSDVVKDSPAIPPALPACSDE